MYKNILVINLMHLGDLLLVTPVLRTLRAAYPQARLTLLADRKLRDIVECNPNLDACLFLDKKGKDDNLWHLLKFICRLRRQQFDLVINLHRNERASALAAFSGGRRIVGYAKPGFGAFFTAVMPNRHFAKHQVYAHYDVLRELAGVRTIEDRGLEMVVPPEAAAKGAALWQREIPADARVIALNIGASWLTKRWLKEYFAICADRLLAEGYHVAFFGGPMDEEIVRECLGDMQTEDKARVHVFTGRVSLGELAELLSRCLLFITTDSGPMHVGVAMHVPVVTMFGASPVTGFAPYDSRAILVKTPEPCHPCRIHECQRQGEEHLACMKHITPEIVLRCAHKLLQESGGRPGRELPAPTAFDCRVIDLARPEGQQLARPQDFAMDTTDTNPVIRLK